MIELTTFIIKNITGSEDFRVTEEEIDDRLTIQVDANQSIVGLIIGKEGKTIKNIRKLLAILATKTDKIIAINVTEQL